MKFLKHEDPLLAIERKKWKDGFSFVAGVDEAGRGPLAGPLVVTALVFRKNSRIPFVNDSKKLSIKKRIELRNVLINSDQVDYSIVEIQPQEIDKLNILNATHKGMKEALTGLKKLDFALIDGLPVPNIPVKHESIVKGDSKSANIAAASILAKVHRDEIMQKIAREYPEYGFEKHKGYGTAFHIDAIKKYGPTKYHRRSFSPLKEILSPIKQDDLFS